jgi:hypothetical protein
MRARFIAWFNRMRERAKACGIELDQLDEEEIIRLHFLS